MCLLFRLAAVNAEVMSRIVVFTAGFALPRRVFGGKALLVVVLPISSLCKLSEKHICLFLLILISGVFEKSVFYRSVPLYAGNHTYRYHNGLINTDGTVYSGSPYGA